MILSATGSSLYHGTENITYKLSCNKLCNEPISNNLSVGYQSSLEP